MAIVGDAFAKPMLRALEEAEAKGTPYDISSLAADHQLGRDVVGRGEAGADGARATSSASTRSARARASASRARSARPAPSTKTAKFTIGATHEGVHRRRRRGRARLRRGRACSRSAATSRVGYYKDEAKSRRDVPRRSTATRWSVPGDFASVEADGTITLLGRGSVVINSGGEKVFPEEVEEAVKVHPAVADCLVVGVPDERFGEAVTAVVSLPPGDDGDRPTSSPPRSRRSRATSARASSCSSPRSCAARTARPTTSGPRPRPPTRAG